MKAYNEYTAALNKHCDEEAAFAAIVASIGHPIKKAECKTRKIQTEATKMPCEIPVCHPICTQEPATLDYSTYTIKYGQMKCVDDQKCENAKAKCLATLTGVMKAAQDAEVSAVLLPRRSRSSISVSRSTALSKTNTPSWSD